MICTLPTLHCACKTTPTWVKIITNAWTIFLFFQMKTLTKQHIYSDDAVICAVCTHLMWCTFAKLI